MKKIKVIGMVAVFTLIVLTACNKTENASVLSIEGIYVGTLKSGNGLKSASNSDVDAVAEVIITGDGQIEVHCYGGELDTLFMLNYYGNHDSVIVCLTGGDFEHMYGHMLGQGHMMGGMMGDKQNGKTDWMHHMSDEHIKGDVHYGGFDMNTNNFSYTFKMTDVYLQFNGHKK